MNNNMNSAPIIRRQVLHVLIGFEALATMLISVNMFRKLVLQSPPLEMFPSPELPLEYWTEHVAIVCQLYVLI